MTSAVPVTSAPRRPLVSAVLAGVTMMLAVGACSATPAEPEGLAPDKAINGTYAVLGKITKLEGRLNGENGFPTVVGDSIPSGDWTIVATCTSPTECTGDVVSSSGRKYLITLVDGVWTGSSEAKSEPCEGPAAAATPTQSKQDFMIRITAPPATANAAPNVLDGSQTRTYTGCNGTATMEGTLSLTRLA